MQQKLLPLEAKCCGLTVSHVFLPFLTEQEREDPLLSPNLFPSLLPPASLLYFISSFIKFGVTKHILL